MTDKTTGVGAKVPQETHDRLAWLAYTRRTTISAIIASYIAKGMAEEDFSRYQPPDSVTEARPGSSAGRASG